MKKNILICMLTLTIGQISTAFAAEGIAELTMNDDETVLVIKGKAAEEMYSRLDVEIETKGSFKYKVGRDFVCKTNSSVAQCVISLGETANGKLNGKID